MGKSQQLLKHQSTSGDFVVTLDFLTCLQPRWSNILLQSTGSLGLCVLLRFVCILCKDDHIYNCRVNCVYPSWPVTLWWKLKNDGQTNVNV